MKRVEQGLHPTVDGSSLREIRNKLGFSANKFAELLGVSVRMYRYYEGGQSAIPKAVGFLAENISRGESVDSQGTLGGVQGTLTSFDVERIKRLADALYDYNEKNFNNLDEKISKLLDQSVKELDLLLSKLE
jgi:transcriptional regulator with XRE-family HTH domain